MLLTFQKHTHMHNPHFGLDSFVEFSILFYQGQQVTRGCASKRLQEKSHLTWKLGAHQRATNFSRDKNKAYLKQNF